MPRQVASLPPAIEEVEERTLAMANAPVARPGVPSPVESSPALSRPQGSFMDLAAPRAAAIAPSTAEVYIRLSNIVKTFSRDSETLQILNNVNLEIRKGAFVSLMGPSGSGKSTLLNIIAGLDRPTLGEIIIGGRSIGGLSEDQLADWRADNIGFVYQQYNLIPVMTALENVELPLVLTKIKRKERLTRARTALRIVGLEERLDHYPRQLSGGQEQRVAIARAIVNDPAVIVADEPTGDLDRASADEILLLLEKLAREFGKTIVMVTHDGIAAERAFVQHRLDKGVVVGA